MKSELHGFHFCQIERDCANQGIPRICGHYACDDHTDSTDLCGWCVPLEPGRAEALANRIRGVVPTIILFCIALGVDTWWH